MTQLKSYILLGYILFIGGLLSLFFAVPLGMYVASGWLSRRGGTDGQTYGFVMEKYTTIFIVAGGIFLSIGLVVLIYMYYQMAKANQ